MRGQHHRVSFDPDGGTPTPDPIIVFASSLAAGYRTMPAAPIRDPDTFNRWSTEPDGIGNPFTAASTLSCSSDGNLDRNGR